MLVALWPRMSRRTCSDTPISAARELHVCLRSWNVRLMIFASRHALVNAFLVSMNRDPVLSLVKIYSPVVSSSHSLFKMAATRRLIGIVRGLPILVFSIRSQLGSISQTSPLITRLTLTEPKFTSSRLSLSNSPLRIPVNRATLAMDRKYSRLPTSPILKSAFSSSRERRRFRFRRAGILARTDFGSSSHGLAEATFSLIAILKIDDSSVTSLLTVVGLRFLFTADPLSSTSLLTVSLFSRSLMNLTTSIIVISSKRLVLKYSFMTSQRNSSCVEDE